MTGGARADRVGAKLSYVVPTKVGSRRKPGIRRKPCMTTVQARTTRKRERRASVNEKCLRRKPPGPWPVKPRLAVVSFLYPGPRGSGRHVSHVAGSEATVTRDGAARRKLGGAQASRSEHGDRLDPWLCSRVVWVAEVDEQRLVLAARRHGNVTGVTTGSSWQALPS